MKTTRQKQAKSLKHLCFYHFQSVKSIQTNKESNKSHRLNSYILCHQAGILKMDIAGSSRFFRCSKLFQHGPGARYIALDIYLKAMRTLPTLLEKGHVFTQMFQAFKHTDLPVPSCTTIFCAKGHIHFALVYPLIQK